MEEILEILEKTLLITKEINKYLENDTDKISDLLDEREKLLLKIQDKKETHILNPAETKIIEEINKQEEEIREKIKNEMASLRNQANKVKTGNRAIKNGYMKINEEFRVKRDFSGRG